MIIEFDKDYYSLGPFKSDELADFTVITGKNGSGKSQLIELLKLYTVQNEQIKPTITPSFQPYEIQFEQLETRNNKVVNNSSWKDHLKSAELDIQPNDKLIILSALKKLGRKVATSENYFNILKDNRDVENALSNFLETSYRVEEYKNDEYPYARTNQNLKIKLQLPIEFYEFVADYKGKLIKDININDLYSCPIPDDYLNKYIFNIYIEDVFYGYAKRRYDNFFHYALKEKGKSKNGAIPDEEFIKNNPAPWDEINKILSENNSKYTLKGIELGDYSYEGNFEFLFIKSDGTEVRFDKLSSGEKIIFGLIFKIFFIKYYGKKAAFPKLLILDEPDAFLHPEMSKLLIDVLYNSFVKELRMKVIITTHSPSTVALSPDNCIYELKNEPNTSLKKVTKDDALKILTGNIPTLNIDYKSHKQVFVESPTDRGYYNNIYLKHKVNNNVSHPLYFLCNDYGKGSSSQVIQVVSDLVKYGSSSIWGVIDWDNKNIEDLDNHILLHGNNERYSIESYLFDPLYLAALFIDTNANNICAELKIDKGIYNPYNIGEESNERLQEIADWVIVKFEDKYGKVNNERKTIEYLNGKKITIPKWLWGVNGHNFWQKFQGIFKSLEKYDTDVKMAVELSEVAARCYPLVSIDTIKIIEQLAK